jgi:hypothetical protein
MQKGTLQYPSVELFAALFDGPANSPDAAATAATTMAIAPIRLFTSTPPPGG